MHVDGAGHEWQLVRRRRWWATPQCPKRAQFNGTARTNKTCASVTQQKCTPGDPRQNCVGRDQTTETRERDRGETLDDGIYGGDRVMESRPH